MSDQTPATVDPNVSAVLAKLDAGLTTKRDYQITQVGIIPRTVDEALTIAKAFAASNYFKDIKDASQAVAKIMYGAELGITPAAAMQGVYFFEGKLTIGGTLLGALVRKSGLYKYKVIESTNEKCVLQFLEREDGAWVEVGVSTFTMADATQAGLAGKDIWKKYPKTMLYNRSMSAGVKMFLPDLFGGMVVYTEDEVDELRANAAPELAAPNPSVNQADKLKSMLAEPVKEPEPKTEGVGVGLPEPGTTDFRSEYDPAADDDAEQEAVIVEEEPAAPKAEEPKKEAAKTAPPSGDLVLGQKLTMEISDRLAAIDGAPRPNEFVKQCKEAGMTTPEQVMAKLAELENKGLGL